MSIVLNMLYTSPKTVSINLKVHYSSQLTTCIQVDIKLLNYFSFWLLNNKLHSKIWLLKTNFCIILLDTALDDGGEGHKEEGGEIMLEWKSPHTPFSFFHNFSERMNIASKNWNY